MFVVLDSSSDSSRVLLGVFSTLELAISAISQSVKEGTPDRYLHVYHTELDSFAVVNSDRCWQEVAGYNYDESGDWRIFQP